MLNPVIDQGGGALPIDRVRIERLIDNLLALLDASEPDPDLEPTADDEPYLGWTKSGSCGDWTFQDDREEGDDNGIADRDGLAEQWPSCFGEMAI